MRMYFGGSEVKMWRDLLEQQQVPNVALSYIGLLRRNKNNADITARWSIADHYPQAQNIFLDSGAYTLNKENSEYTYEDAVKLAQQYMEFVSANIDRVSLVSEFDAKILGFDRIRDTRTAFYDNLDPDKFMPIWHEEYGLEELERMCSSYNVVGVPVTYIGDKSLIPVLNGYVRKYGVRLHGVAITGRKLLKEVRWDSVASMSWLSPLRFGDTIIWVGNELKRYPKAYKKKARELHGDYLTRNGFDVDKIQEDDGKEILKLSLWSWLKFSETLERVTNVTRNEKVNFAENGYDGVDTQGGTEWNGNLLPAIPETSAFELALRGQNTEAKSLEQRKVLLSALIDVQAQRVLELKKLEDQEGRYADINFSAEADRLAKYIRQQNDMERQSFSLKIEASAPTGEGFMSTMFGPGIGDKLNTPDPFADAKPTTKAEVIPENDVHDAEIVDE